MTLTVSNMATDEKTDVPEHIEDRTENLLSPNPMTNQRVILDTASWWLENVGNCAIYRYVVNHLDQLENESVRQQADVFHDAVEQARDVGLDV